MYSSGKLRGVVCTSAAAKRRTKLTATIPASSRRAGIAAARASPSGRGKETSTATKCVSAWLGCPLNEGYFVSMGVADMPLARVSWAARLREPAVRGAQLFAASGFALAQPLFDILGKNAEFFAVRGSTPGDIVLFALAVTFLPALVLLAFELAIGVVNPAAARVFHHLFLGFLGAVFGVQALKRSGLSGTELLIAGAVAIGLAVALAVWWLQPARSFLTLLSATPVLFLALFLFNTPVEKLVFESGGAQAAAIQTKATTPIVFLLFDEFPVIDLQDARDRKSVV